ncbi:hypothetical protein [Clostridium sp.]|uniref:hypothetical protein n=1 Tax=Clostridium sp. TaxID=1506 RepID=UPI002851D2F6|nr:hypothetical protein [Clostridium sp.]MDR3594681.1 hypothetical protein [Clostridium sp.]
MLSLRLKHASKYNYPFTLNSTMNNTPMNESLMRKDTAIETDTSDFTPDDWVRYSTPLVDRALEEFKEGNNPEHYIKNL